jgi:DNA (cytosine-5)-methyltransferase 1
MDKLRVLDLFSGIGGFSLGLERTGGFETVAFCEIEPFPRRVLAKHWPEVPCYDDVRTLTAERLRADGICVDVICGGFPCQDVSLCGARAGLEGERSGLWAEINRLVGELRPKFLIVENTPGLLSLGMGRVLGDLATRGYDAEWDCISAAIIGAPHERDRVWLVAYPNEVGCAVASEQLAHIRQVRCKVLSAAPIVPVRSEVWDDRVLPSLGLADGLPTDLGAVGAFGNSVVPQIPELIGNAILASLMMEEAA